MNFKNRFRIACFGIAMFFASQGFAQVPTPKEHFGFNIGDDYQLANYTQLEAYFKKIDAASDRAKLVDIGKSEEGRSQWMMIVTSPENHKNLAKYKEISQKLARAEGLTPAQAKELAAEGKAVVWIDGGIHSNEVVGAHQLMQMAYLLSAKDDKETKDILDNVIVLLTHANPDGMEMMNNWYMRNSDPLKRSIANYPRLYQKYGGHNNNRDFFMLNMRETQNMARQLFVEWIPQIMYNHHQTGPAGTVVAGPPYRDPFNYVFDPIVMTSIDALGAAMHTRLNAEGKPGYTQRNGAVFSTWYNGGLRTTTYFHNMIGLLTEITGSPTPSEIPFVPSRLLPNGDSPNPVLPQKWNFQKSIDYSVSLNYAVLGYAQRYSDELLYNIYQMGANSIEKGSKDTWSLSPKKIDAMSEAVKKASATAPGGRAQASVAQFDAVMKAPENRDPRGYIIPADQKDLPSVVRFLNALIQNGIVVHTASSNFTVNGKNYPKGSYIVKTAQAFRPHILDMFEPQDHPNDFKYEGAPPTSPYDAAGWTMAYLMNIKFDRIMDNFDGPFVRNVDGEQISLTTPALPAGSGYTLNAEANMSFFVVNELLKNKQEVFRNATTGAFYVPATAKAKEIIAASKYGMQVVATQKPANAIKLNPSRIAIWDVYGGSMDSGWIRFIMEHHNFDATVIYAPDIDAGNLKSKFDAIIFVDGAIPAYSANAAAAPAGPARNMGPDPLTIPEEFRGRLGRVTQEKSIPKIKEFMEAGGKVVAIGNGTNLAAHLNLPVSNAMVEMVNGVERRLPSEKYYVPGSVLRVAVDTNQPANWGLDANTDVYFDNSPVFKLSPSAVTAGQIKPLAWYADAEPLRSGWAWGQSYLKDGIAAFEANVGKGKLYAFGPKITFRGQTHGTFKWMLNQLYN